MNSVQRYFLELAYNGSAYHGWQIQPNAVTVQEVLDRVLSTILKQNITTLGCGRTDTGVHARQFFSHFDRESEIFPSDLPELLIRVNALLPEDISVGRIIPVHQDAHARFDAIMRSYEYHIHFRKNPFKTGISSLVKKVPDIHLMNDAALLLKSYNDFSCFSKSRTQVFTNNCKIMHAEWTDDSDSIIFKISADRFLRNMVRAIVGTLLDIGWGKIPVGQLDEIIRLKDRSNAGISVPARGLHLTEVKYSYIDTG